MRHILNVLILCREFQTVQNTQWEGHCRDFGAVQLFKNCLSKPIIKLPALVSKGSKQLLNEPMFAFLQQTVPAGCCQPHNMHTCCNWEVVLLVKWEKYVGRNKLPLRLAGFIDKGCRSSRQPGNNLNFVTEPRGCMVLSDRPGRPSSHHTWTRLSWLRSGCRCRWTERGERRGGGKQNGIWMI